MPKIYTDNAIAVRIREQRLKRGWTQKELADKSCITYYLVCLYERGTRIPSYQTLSRVAQSLGVSVEYLTGDTDDERVS